MISALAVESEVNDWVSVSCTGVEGFEKAGGGKGRVG